MSRIGPKMAMAVEYVRAHPGCTKHEAALHVGANGSSKYGYETVDRAIAAGLIRAESKGSSRYSLYVAEE